MGFFHSSPFFMKSLSFSWDNMFINQLSCSKFINPFLGINGDRGFNVKNSVFNGFLSNALIIEQNCQNYQLITERDSFVVLIENTYFKDILSATAGGSFYFLNDAMNLMITKCHFVNSRSTGSASYGTRADAGGGGFCSVSKRAFFSKLCFSNCSSVKVGPVFYSQVPSGSKQEYNDSTMVLCSTSLHNSWSQDWGYIHNENLNGTYLYTSNGNACGYRVTSDGCCVKYSHFFNCTAKGNTYGIIGDYSPSSVQCNVDHCNFIRNFGDKSIICIYSSSSIVTIIKRTSFIDNVAPNPVTYTNAKPQFIECWGQFSFSTAQGSFTNCNFNNFLQTHSFNIDFCECNLAKSTFNYQMFFPNSYYLYFAVFCMCLH